MNTLKIFKSILITIAFTSTLCIAQEQDAILKKLDSKNSYEQLQALGIIDDNNLVQYSGDLEERIFFQKDPFNIYIYLRTLSKLESPNLYSIVKKFFDTIDYYPNVDKRIDLLKAKSFAAGILINFNDYSKVNYIFELTDRDKQQQTITPGIVALLSKLLYNSVFENQAKEELLYFFNNNNYKSMPDGLANPRSGILSFLKDKYGLAMTDLIINSFLFDPSVSIRGASLNFLTELNYSGLDTLLIYKLYMESDSIMRPQVALTIATRLNTPERYYILKNYRPPIQNEHRVQGIASYLSTIKPKAPVTENTIQNIDTTESFINNLLTYTWLGDLTFSNELKNILTTAKTNLQNGDSLACRVQVKAFQDLVDNVYKDSLNSDPRFVTIEGWKFLYWNAQYILDRLPEPQSNPNLFVNLKNSLGVQIPASNVMYYESATSGWKDAVNNGDGTFTVITTKPTVSIRMFYEYANQTVHNVPAQNNTYTFTTVNAAVQLKNSLGSFLDVGTVQYYAGAWRNFGTTTNGVAYKELLPVNYSFRMTYEYIPNDKQQDISTNSTVIFTTVLCTVKVTNTNNQPLAGASTKYYSLAWRDIGLTNANGIITKELLPKNLSFRATYNNVSLDKQQDIGVNNLVEIQLNTQ